MYPRGLEPVAICFHICSSNNVLKMYHRAEASANVAKFLRYVKQCTMWNGAVNVTRIVSFIKPFF
jgi:hypothetical protein